MGTRSSAIPGLLIGQLAVLFFLISCGASQPEKKLTVHVRKDFVGRVRIATCVKSAADADIFASDEGDAQTSACPKMDEEVAVILLRGEQVRNVAAEDIVIPRTGDGISTSILVSVREDPK